MLINFILAIVLTVIAISAILTLDQATNFGTSLIRGILKLTRRSKILTEYILRAYLRYRKTIKKQNLILSS
jgi:hypothetical protein